MVSSDLCFECGKLWVRETAALGFEGNAAAIGRPRTPGGAAARERGMQASRAAMPGIHERARREGNAAARCGNATPKRLRSIRPAETAPNASITPRKCETDAKRGQRPVGEGQVKLCQIILGRRSGARRTALRGVVWVDRASVARSGGAHMELAFSQLKANRQLATCERAADRASN